jgi:hypothetical protein
MAEKEKPRQLHQDDIPALMCLVMDRMGITEFKFTTKELMEVKGRIILDHEDPSKSSYIMRRAP